MRKLTLDPLTIWLVAGSFYSLLIFSLIAGLLVQVAARANDTTTSLESRRLFFTREQRLEKSRQKTDTKLTPSRADIENRSWRSPVGGSNNRPDVTSTHPRQDIKTDDYTVENSGHSREVIHYQAILAVGTRLQPIVNDLPCYEKPRTPTSEYSGDLIALSCPGISNSSLSIYIQTHDHHLFLVPADGRRLRLKPGESR